MLKDIDELKKLLNSKVDCSLFDEEMGRLKNLINQLASSGKEISTPIVQTGPSISSKELNDIREAIKKVAEHEEKFKNLNIDTLLKKLNQLQEDVHKTRTDIMKLENDKAEKLNVEGSFKRVDKELKKLNDWCENLDEMIKKLMNTNNDQ
jgi:hypothetical protein